MAVSPVETFLEINVFKDQTDLFFPLFTEFDWDLFKFSWNRTESIRAYEILSKKAIIFIERVKKEKLIGLLKTDFAETY